MVLGRLFHYTFDIVLLSTVLAGVKRHTGFQCVGSLSRSSGRARQWARAGCGWRALWEQQRRARRAREWGCPGRPPDLQDDRQRRRSCDWKRRGQGGALCKARSDLYVVGSSCRWRAERRSAALPTTLSSSAPLSSPDAHLATSLSFELSLTPLPLVLQVLDVEPARRTGAADRQHAARRRRASVRAGRRDELHELFVRARAAQGQVDELEAIVSTCAWRGKAAILYHSRSG